MKDGVIADFEISEAMLRYFIEKVDKKEIVPLSCDCSPLWYHRRRKTCR